MKKILYFLVSLVMIASILPFSALADDLTVIAFGDSITAADKWQKHIEAEYGIDIINAGVGGDTTNSAKTRFKRDVLDKKPDIVFISLGVNDCAIDMSRYVDLETYKANMAYFIDECEKVGAKVIVNIPTPVVDEQYLTRHKKEPFEPYGGPNGIVTVYADACREVAIEKGVAFADLNAYFQGLDGGYAKYFPDGVHPSDTGYKMYADVVMEAYQSLWLGDVNFDGVIDRYDYILVKRICMKTVTLSEKQLLSADVNKNGKTDTYDYILIKRHCMKTFAIA
jgi:lysophospholipase L1-like esterase